MVTILVVAALLLHPVRPDRTAPMRENVAAGDSLLRCYITMDGTTSGSMLFGIPSLLRISSSQQRL